MGLIQKLRVRNVDIFGILNTISEKKNEFMRSGMKEKDASKKARHIVSKEYCIPLNDIVKIYGV